MMTPTTAARLPATLVLAAALALVLAACATTGSTDGEPLVAWDEPAAPAEPETFAQEQDSPQEEGEVPLSIAESAPPVDAESLAMLDEVIVEGRLGRHEQIHSLVQEARVLLEDVELEYVFTGKGRNQVLRGRPVAFALWSEVSKEWTIAHLEIPRPPVNWKPGRKPLSSRMITPGITARHVKGTGAERLMFSFSKGDEQLKVYGRKFPVFDSALIKKKRWREVAETARPIIYLPFTEDTLDPGFITGGREFLLATARRAIEELRQANAPSAAYPGELLADVVPAEVLTTLAVIEQLDDSEFVKRQEGAFNEVLNHYGLKLEEAYRYSVSSASAIGPMQFTNRRGNGTYALVVRRCPEARIDPDFERGATNLLNAMKAAICLFDIELQQMKPEIRAAYRDNSAVLGIFPVAAYNGGPRNVTRLHNVIRKMKVALSDLRRPGEPPFGIKPVTCPCVWKAVGSEVHPVAIPRYNNENRWYIEKYQKILLAFE